MEEVRKEETANNRGRIIKYHRHKMKIILKHKYNVCLYKNNL
jgi:hypothetical protein